MSEPFIAEIRIFAGNFAPRGWAFCDGQLLPISQHTALFSLIGTTYGGDGRSTTALPNMQGRAPMGAGRGPGLTARRQGEKVGAEMVSLTEAQMPSHNHAMFGSSNSIEDGTGVPEARLTGSDEEGDLNTYAPAQNLTAFASDAMTTTGGGQPHNNMQPFISLSYIIALTGLYPSRS